ncbi:hypothetical protein DH2020_006303 [Rehmannia glutinosa]|uniref:S-adenosylmethionine-dependent methyltransferase n=1 Tax=Rehmannia glutinosa TaxID=99300 RepID=A0ABR0XIG7_REHGL
MAQAISPMKGGDDTYSYVKNSSLQRDGLNAAKDMMKEALIQNLDIKKLLSGSTTFTIVFFNDLTANDFNTLFASLPDERKKYFAAGVPGSFFTRLFPCSSIHIAYSSSSLHWLSKLPVELQDKNSPAWNPGRIHYTGAPEAVVRAYANQFEEDMVMFLNARSQEIVGGGMIVILMPGVPDGVLTHDVGIALTFLGSILMDMVQEGLLKQDQVDLFNFPHVYPSVKQMTRLVEKNGCFEIIKMEQRNARTNTEAPIDIESAIMHLRAFTQESVANHMGTQIVDQLFTKALQQKSRFSYMLYSSGIEIGVQLFSLLKRK